MTKDELINQGLLTIPHHCTTVLIIHYNVLTSVPSDVVITVALSCIFTLEVPTSAPQ